MNTPIIIALSIVFLLAIASFVGITKGASKNFSIKQTSNLNGQNIQKSQRESIESTEEKRRQLMENMRQKILDNRR